jgi:Xaa-Pro aminopeptidase
MIPSRIALVGTLTLLLAVPAAARGQMRMDTWAPPADPPPLQVTAAEHGQRRAALAGAMGDGVLVVLGEPEPDADYEVFAQNAAFRYLTGVTEPGAALVMEKRAGRVRETLFVQARDPSRELWEGARMGPAGALAATGIPARAANALRPVLDSLLATRRTLYTISTRAEDATGGEGIRPDQRLVDLLTATHPGVQVVPLDAAFARLRGLKSPAELDMVRRAVLVTTLALRETIRAVRPGMAEFEAQALVEGTFRRNGAERPSFASIVGSGRNSTALHYSRADRTMAAGEVVVMDVGASYRGYAADVTRTLPVGGTFTPAQRDLYAVVLDAQKAAEAQAGPGATWPELDAAANAAIAGGLARLGLIDGPGATYRCGPQAGGQCLQYQLYYPHALGHGIGLDVHDPDASYWGRFAAGSAFTLEPGVYVRGDVLAYLADVPENRALRARLQPAVDRYRDTGIRIEDDYFVTAAGVERVSAGVPREMAEVEALMREDSPWNAMRRPDVVEWYRVTSPK